jgi:hemerythrin
MINELSDAMIDQKGDKTVPQILQKLVDYIQLHFTTASFHDRGRDYAQGQLSCSEETLPGTS